MVVHSIKDANELKLKLTEAGDKLVVIDFFATWCGPCKFISPKIEEMSGENTDVVFLKIDVDICEDLACQYEISSMPTFVFIKNHKKIDAFSGANADKLVEMIGKLK